MRLKGLLTLPFTLADASATRSRSSLDKLGPGNRPALFFRLQGMAAFAKRAAAHRRCGSSCTSLKCPYFSTAYRSACRCASGPLKISLFASAIIVKPFDAPLAGRLAILKNHRWLRHRLKSCGITPRIANVAGASSAPFGSLALPRSLRRQRLRLRFGVELLHDVPHRPQLAVTSASALRRTFGA